MKKIFLPLLILLMLISIIFYLYPNKHEQFVSKNHALKQSNTEKNALFIKDLDVPLIKQPIDFNYSSELLYYIEIENIKNGNIAVVENNNQRKIIGKVTHPATRTYISSDGFWASHYTVSSKVVGIGANALHIKVGPVKRFEPTLSLLSKENVQNPYLVSLLPKNTENSKTKINTNISGGEEIFGGTFSPYSGSDVYYFSKNNSWEKIEDYYNINSLSSVPTLIRIEVKKKTTNYGDVKEIIFENKKQGDILINFKNGKMIKTGVVLQPVNGTGRFAGSEFVDIGRVRANHGGVICLSTSPDVGFTYDTNKRGGFQIIPINHAKYLNKYLKTTYIGQNQWMIIAPLETSQEILGNDVFFEEPYLEGNAPFFNSYIKPDNIIHFKVSFDNGSTYKTIHSLTGVISNSLKDVTHIKLILE